jgi:hypothetical protein
MTTKSRVLPRGKRRLVLAAALLVGILLLANPAPAMDSEHYAIPWDVMGGGGGPIGSETYAIDATIGQPSIGSKTSETYGLCSGFWCGARYNVYLPIAIRDHAP